MQQATSPESQRESVNDQFTANFGARRSLTRPSGYIRGMLWPDYIDVAITVARAHAGSRP